MRRWKIEELVVTPMWMLVMGTQRKLLLLVLKADLSDPCGCDERRHREDLRAIGKVNSTRYYRRDSALASCAAPPSSDSTSSNKEWYPDVNYQVATSPNHYSIRQPEPFSVPLHELWKSPIPPVSSETLGVSFRGGDSLSSVPYRRYSGRRY